MRFYSLSLLSSLEFLQKILLIRKRFLGSKNNWEVDLFLNCYGILVGKTGTFKALILESIQPPNRLWVKNLNRSIKNFLSVGQILINEGKSEKIVIFHNEIRPKQNRPFLNLKTMAKKPVSCYFVWVVWEKRLGLLRNKKETF